MQRDTYSCIKGKASQLKNSEVFNIQHAVQKYSAEDMFVYVCFIISGTNSLEKTRDMSAHNKSGAIIMTKVDVKSTFHHFLRPKIIEEMLKKFLK